MTLECALKLIERISIPIISQVPAIAITILLILFRRAANICRSSFHYYFKILRKSNTNILASENFFTCCQDEFVHLVV